MKKLLHTLLPLVTLLMACSSQIQNTPEGFSDERNGLVDPTQQAFQEACVDQSRQDGPWKNDLVLSWFDSKGQEESQTLVKGGGVPTVIQEEDGTLLAAFQWFPCDNAEAFDQVAVSMSEDDGVTWSEPELIEIEDFPEAYQRPFDPTLALLPDGRIRIYYTSNANGLSTFNGDTQIYSAISDDGIHYTFEEGSRWAVEELPAYDSAVGYWDGLWHIITPNNIPDANGGAHHGSSEDGLTFTTQEDLDFTAKLNWTGNFVTREDGLYFYGTAEGTGNWWTYFDGEEWSEVDALQTRGGDPAVACIQEDRCFIITVQMPGLKL
jgi:hypothetical protein